MTIKKRTFIVAGYAYHQYEYTNLNVGDLVYLIPEPDNEYDENAIRVYSNNGVVIGYVPMEENERFFTKKYSNYCARVKSLNKIGNDTQPEVEIFLAKTEDELPFKQPTKYILRTIYGSGNSVTYEVVNAERNNDNNKSCFVATAAYQNINHPNVDYLRWYRDSHLMPNKFGKMFITIYYIVGPLISIPVKKYQFINKITRKIINRIVILLKNNY